MSLSRRILIAVSCVVLIVGGCAYLDTFQREMIFRPNKDEWYGSSRYTDNFEEAWIPVVSRIHPETTIKLHAWWAPAQQAHAPTLLYLHGARWNLSGSARRIAHWRELGFSVLAIDYRGFGKSTDVLPSEQQVYEDAQAAWDYLKTKHAHPTQRFVYGHSLGSAVAVELATRNADMAGLILEASFTSLRDVVLHTKYSFLPIDTLLTQHFDSRAKIANLKMPMLFIHGMEDRIVPVTLGEQLYSAAKAPKKMLLVEGAGHSNVSWIAADRYRAAVGEFLGLIAQAKLITSRDEG